MIINGHPDKVILQNYSVEEIRHPDDESIIKWTKYLPGFDSFFKEMVGNIREAYCDVEASGDGWNVTAQSSPQIYGKLIEACRILNVKDVPNFNTKWYYGPISYSSGKMNFRVTIGSGAVDLLTEEELLFLIAHELGHSISGHKPYQMLLESFYLPFANNESVKVWSKIIRIPLLDWYRKSDFTADRFALLCCQDIDVALNVMIKTAGLPKKCYNEINIPAFLEQAREFERNHAGNMDKLVKTLSLRSCEYPWMVHRAAFLYSWYVSGQYERIINRNR